MYHTLFYCLLNLASMVYGLHWLGFTHPSNHTWSDKDCDKEALRGNIRTLDQLLFCRKYHRKMSLIIKSNELTKEACKSMLYMQRWNCSRIDSISDGFLPYELHQDTAESAFVHALSAATITYRYTRMCYKNKDCSCGGKGIHWFETDEHKESKIKFHKCANYFKKGVQFAKEFAESAYPLKINSRKIIKSNKIKRYNQKIGRKVVKRNREIKCECFGTSVNCAAKVCYKKIPPFIEIANDILAHYRKASNTQNRNNYKQVIFGSEKNLDKVISPENEGFKERTNRMTISTKKVNKANLNKFKLTKSSGVKNKEVNETSIKKFKPLQFLKHSPNYCDKDEQLGLPGTQGRMCNINVTDHSSCKTLCCGRGFRVKRYTKIIQCHCKYIHCCRIECEQCKVLQIDYTCK